MSGHIRRGKHSHGGCKKPLAFMAIALTPCILACVAVVFISRTRTRQLATVETCAREVVENLPEVEEVRFVATFTETFQSRFADECYFGRVFVAYETPLELTVAQARVALRLQELGWEVISGADQIDQRRLVRGETQLISIESSVGPLTRWSEDYQNATRLYAVEFTVTVECITPSPMACGMR